MIALGRRLETFVEWRCQWWLKRIRDFHDNIPSCGNSGVATAAAKAKIDRMSFLVDVYVTNDRKDLTDGKYSWLEKSVKLENGNVIKAEEFSRLYGGGSNFESEIQVKAQGGRGTRDWSLEEWLEQSCQKCGSPSDIDLLICEAGNGCTRCYHTVCVGLEGIPKGKWHCPECTIKQEDM